MYMFFIYFVIIIIEIGIYVKMEKIRKFSFENKSNVFGIVSWYFVNIYVEKIKGGFFFVIKF